MKIKTVLTLVVVSVFCLVGCPTIVSGQQEKEQSQSVEQLQEKISELEITIKNQQQNIKRIKKNLDEQIKENEILKNLCRIAGVNIIKIVDESFNHSEIVYRGKKRTQKWLDMMYKELHDKIAFIDDRYIDVGRKLLRLRGIWTTNKPTSEKYYMGVAPYESKVLSVLENGDVLINYNYENILHISGVEHNFVDGNSWPINTPLIRNGTFKYTTALGGRKTVMSFIIYKPITKDQFTEAIARGFELVNYKKTDNIIVGKSVR